MQRPIQSTVTPSPRRRLRAAYALLTIPVALATLMTLSPAKATTTGQQVMKSSVSKIFPASTIGKAGSRVQLFQVKIYPGSYHIEMPVTVKHLNADAIDYIDVSLVCKDNYGHADQMGQAVNTLHGTSFTLTPRVYITFTGTMRGVCVGYAQETRQRGPASVAPSTRALLITSAKMIVTPSSSSARETVRFKGDSSANNHPYVGHSSRASKGVHFHAAPVTFNSYPSATHSFAMTGNVYLTSCTTSGGSRDATTNGKNLCIPSVVKPGGTRTAGAYTAGGPAVPGRRRHALPLGCGAQHDLHLPHHALPSPPSRDAAGHPDPPGAGRLRPARHRVDRGLRRERTLRGRPLPELGHLGSAALVTVPAGAPDRLSRGTGASVRLCLPYCSSTGRT